MVVIILKVKIKKEYKDFLLDKEWQVDKGEIISLFGPSGSGKSLTIQAITGLISPDEGFVKIEDQYIFHKQKKISLAVKDREIGYVPQNYGLFPHLKVHQNIAFGMSKKESKKIRETKIDDLLRKVGLENKKDRYPDQISGGEKQRVAILRALATNPKVLLLDEPFSALDSDIRRVLREEIKAFLKMWNIPVVLVTHDQEDLNALATKIVNYH